MRFEIEMYDKPRFCYANIADKGSSKRALSQIGAKLTHLVQSFSLWAKSGVSVTKNSQMFCANLTSNHYSCYATDSIAMTPEHRIKMQSIFVCYSS